MATKSRPSSARPTALKRSSIDRSSRTNENLVYDCKAAYLVVSDSIEDEIDTRKQLIEALQQAGRNPTRKVLKEYWTNDTESISFDEFVDICRKEKPTSEEDLMHAFKKIDINGDGYIDNFELKKVLTTRGERMTTNEVQDIIDDVDENKDGRLDYREFCRMMLSTQEQCKKLSIEHMEKKTKKKSSFKASRDDADSDMSLEPEPHLNGSQKATKFTKKKPEGNLMKKGASKKGISNLEQVSLDATTSDDDDDDGDIIFGTLKSSARSTHSTNKMDKLGSQLSVKSGKSEAIENMGSSASLRSIQSDNSLPRPQPRPRLIQRKSSKDWSPDMSRPSPRVKERSKSPVSGKDLRLAKPKRLKDWTLSHSKGCFYFDDDNKIILSHHYEMKIAKDTSVWITIEPISIRPGNDLNSKCEEGRAPMDTTLFVLRDDDSLVTFTEQRDAKGKYGVRCDLERGTYKLIPFTTGCRFKPRTSEPSSESKLVKKVDDKYTLTKAFKEALVDIFEMCDLDGNGFLSRSEFDYFSLRTSGEEVNDKEWGVVEGSLDLKNGEITRQGFIHLNQMEADDNKGDTEELWVTLSSMGFNKALTMDEACPFMLDIYSESCTAKLTVTHMDKGGRALEQAVVDATMGKGEAVKIRGMRDLFLHTYMNDFRACMVIENKSHHNVKASLDSGRSENCTSNTRNMEHTITVPSKSSMIGQHLMPTKETKAWSVKCQENVIK